MNIRVNEKKLVRHTISEFVVLTTVVFVYIVYDGKYHKYIANEIDKKIELKFNFRREREAKKNIRKW